MAVPQLPAHPSVVVCLAQHLRQIVYLTLRQHQARELAAKLLELVQRVHRPLTQGLLQGLLALGQG